MEGILSLSTILTIVGILVVLANIVAQVLKKATWGKLPTIILRCCRFSYLAAMILID